MPLQRIYKELDPEVIECALGRGRRVAGLTRRGAFGKLHDHYEERVRYAVAKAAMNTAYQHRIDDLRQEVWCRFAEGKGGLLGYYDPERGSFGPFITRLAYQQALREVQTDRRQNIDGAATYTDDVEDTKMASLFAQLIQTDLYEKLMARAEADLNDNEKILLREIHVEGRSCLEVARRHDINQNTIYKQNQRLKDRLKEWADELLRSAPELRDPETPPPRSAAVVALIVAALASASIEAELTRSFPPEPEPEFHA